MSKFALMLAVLSLSFSSTSNDLMKDYNYDKFSKQEIEKIYEQLPRPELSASTIFSHRYKLVHAQAYQMYKYEMIKSAKVNINFTQKWDKYISANHITAGGKSTGKLKLMLLNLIDTFPKAEYRILRDNLKWKYNTTIVLMDKEDTPYALDTFDVFNNNKKNKLDSKLATLDDWVQAMVDMARRSLNAQVGIIDYLLKNYDDFYSIKQGVIELSLGLEGETVKQVKTELEKRKQKLLVILNDVNKKGCVQVNTMYESDRLHFDDNTWCTYKLVPMYYWNNVDIRQATYGNIDWNYQFVVPEKFHNASNYSYGLNNIKTSFDEYSLKHSLKLLD